MEGNSGQGMSGAIRSEKEIKRDASEWLLCGVIDLTRLSRF